MGRLYELCRDFDNRTYFFGANFYGDKRFGTLQ